MLSPAWVPSAGWTRSILVRRVIAPKEIVAAGEGRALPVEDALDVRGAAVEAVDRPADDIVGPDPDCGVEARLDQPDGQHRRGVREHQCQVEVREEHVGADGVQDRTPDGEQVTERRAGLGAEVAGSRVLQELQFLQDHLATALFVGRVGGQHILQDL